MTEKVTHYERDGRRVKFDYYEKRGNRDGTVDVLGFGTYGRRSVLSGQPMKKFLGCFPSEAAAESVYGSMHWWNKYLSAEASVSHLPGEDDPVPGGMYPDDW